MSTYNGEPKAVTQDPERYESKPDAIRLLELIAEGEEAVQQERVKPQEQVFRDIAKRLRRF